MGSRCATSLPIAGWSRAKAFHSGNIGSTCCTVPGTHPGIVVFVHHAARFALVGDVLFQGSVGRTDFPYGDHPALIRGDQDEVAAAGR